MSYDPCIYHEDNSLHSCLASASFSYTLVSIRAIQAGQIEKPIAAVG